MYIIVMLLHHIDVSVSSRLHYLIVSKKKKIALPQPLESGNLLLNE